MVVQDIQNGNGLAFLDPHGKTAELLLDYVPADRINDVLYFAPFDMENPISFNVMEDVGPDKRHLVANGLMSTFEKIWVDAWSARMAYILNNTLLALLEFPGATLLGINRMLSDKDYRKRVVENISDPSVKSFWVDEFGKYTERFAAEATPAIQNKVGQFTSNPLIRNIIGQPKSAFDLRKMMDQNKIIIVNLSKGLVGEGNANLLGSMLITKIYLAAMSRADVPEAKRDALPNFFLYVDEFQSFANKSFADILSEARKYKLNLLMAHQYIEQMSEEVRAAVFGNVGTMVTFRVGAFDAEVLEKEFAPQFTAEDLVNLGIFQTYMKLMIDGVSSSPFSAVTLPPIAKAPMTYKEEILKSSRRNFARPRADVEAEIRTWHEAYRPALKPAAPSLKKDDQVVNKVVDKVIDKVVDKKNGKDNILSGNIPKVSIPKENLPPRPNPFAKVLESLRHNQIKSEKAPEIYSATNNRPKFEDKNTQSGASIPLSSLNSPLNQKRDFKKNDPKESEKNRADLRSALSAVLSKEKTKEKKSEISSPPPASIKKESTPEDQTLGLKQAQTGSNKNSNNNILEAPSGAESKKPDSKEVPESVLRDILNINS